MFKHMSPSVSPMIASGRFLKELYKDAKVVFSLPVSRKARDKRAGLRAIDFVINFRNWQRYSTLSTSILRNCMVKKKTRHPWEDGFMPVPVVSVSQ